MYDSVIGDFARAELDWERDTFKVLLLTSDYRPDQSGHATRADVRSFEIEGSGTYQRGGASLTGRSVSERSGVTRLEAGRVEWANVTAEFRFAVVYQSNGSAAEDRLVSYVDFGRAQIVDNARVLFEYVDGGVVEFVAEAA